MLQLKNIKKIYELGKKGEKNYQLVKALNGVSLEFRKSEFVSILGPSGCGKTTLLNIVGGLDHYSEGDLIINGKSTKDFKDKDWDTYRNHSVGFVFQSYNLIPHLTVVQNVELALTLSGVKPEERHKRASEVLEKVGLGDKIHSRPNQLSGGQMQRVAIARALVNDPEIILADEPTGALDSKTSVQIMELLKEIAKERLIIMVTHNPELADKYSTRIIRLLDGEIEGDTMPFDSSKEKPADDNLVSLTADENLTGEEKAEKNKKKRMSFWTALTLSFKNLLTKKARTFLVSFAGSIGIIGIALILSLSSGFQTYINNVQEDTLSTYPITISSATMDYGTLFESLMSGNQSDETRQPVENAVTSDDIIVGMFQSILSGSKANDLKSFKAYLDGEGKEEIEKYVTAIQYTYNLNLNIYNKTSNGQNEILLNPNSMFYEGVMAWLKGMAIKSITPTPEFANLQTAYKNAHPEFTGEASAVTYEHILSDANLAPSLQTMIETAINNIIDRVTGAMGGGMSMGGMNMGGINNFDSLKSTDMGLWSEMIDNPTLINSQYDVVAVASDKNAETLINNLQYNEVVLVTDKDGFLGDYALYALGLKTTPSIEDIAMGLLNSQDYEIEKSSIPHNQIINKTYTLLADTDYYIYKTTDGGNVSYSLTETAGAQIVDMRKELENGAISQEKYNELLTQIKNNAGTELIIKGILTPKEDASATSITGAIGYTKNLTTYMSNKIDSAIAEKGATVSSYKIDINNPSTISIYCVDFEAKGEIEKIINAYNASVDEDKQISYTDYVGIMMSSVSSIISAITYVLIAFVAVSLIVSSIMIGIITYISVLERTKEIGVLRSIGASKRDIKRVFTAESLIIGFAAGAFGIIVTLILTIPINIIINALAGISGVASLPWLGGIILVAISMLLTFIAGLIPARVASKKDPVIALRSE